METQLAIRTRQQEIAQTILEQLGGLNRLNAMLGLKDLMVNGYGLSFKISVKAAANYVNITLTSDGLYYVELGKIRGKSYNIVANFQGVYADQLKSIIEDTAKVRLSL